MSLSNGNEDFLKFVKVENINSKHIKALNKDSENNFEKLNIIYNIQEIEILLTKLFDIQENYKRNINYLIFAIGIVLTLYIANIDSMVIHFFVISVIAAFLTLIFFLTLFNQHNKEHMISRLITKLQLNLKKRLKKEEEENLLIIQEKIKDQEIQYVKLEQLITENKKEFKVLELELMGKIDEFLIKNKIEKKQYSKLKTKTARSTTAKYKRINK